MLRGSAIYFDGKTTARQNVVIELAPDALLIRDPQGQVLAQWPYATLAHIPSPDQVLRLAHGRDSLARLEIRDASLAAAVDDMALSVDRTGRVQRRLSFRIAGLVVLAVVSLATIALLALPALASRLAPLLPVSVERKLGQAVDAQLRTTLGGGRGGLPLECGTGDAEKAGLAAVTSLFRRLEAEAALPFRARIGVLRRPERNAVALPGGQIYLFEGLIDQAETPDELAGVIAHELGHVARRDGVKALLETAGLSFLFGMVFGDFVGGGAIVLAARTVLQSSYSREAEAAADAYAVALMDAAGGKAEALGTLLTRIEDLHGKGPSILLDHPLTSDRVAAIASLSKPQPRQPLLDAAQWAALKQICVGR